MKNQNSKDPLRRSIDKFKTVISPHTWDMCHESLDLLERVPTVAGEWLAAPSNDAEIVRVFETARQVAVNALFYRIGVSLDLAASSCESPIEQILFAAMFTACVDRQYNLEVKKAMGSGLVTILSSRLNAVELPGRPSKTVITIQAPLGSFRVDFLIEDLSHVIMPDGNVVISTTSVVVECDGHEFHDRTKKQASRDRSRDRALQQLGYRVFRYTGSDIWNNPFPCALDTLLYLEDERDKQHDKIRSSASNPSV